MLRAIFVAVPAFNLVEPARISGPVISLISISVEIPESVKGTDEIEIDSAFMLLE